MIRFTLRQFRTHALVATCGLIAVFAVIVLTRGRIGDLYDSTVANCGDVGNCDSAIPGFLQTYSTIGGWLGVLVVVVPGLIGVFWGAPLVAREIEHGTFRLAWTQSVTRTRWLGAKLGVIGLAAMATAGLLSLLVTWWANLLDKAGLSLYDRFDQRGIVPIGHALFAFVLGVTAGLLIRRTLPAMATTLVAFIATRLAFVFWVRPNLFTPATQRADLDPRSMGFGSTDGGPMTLMPNPPDLENAWIRSIEVVDEAGDPMSSDYLATACPDIPAPPRVGSGDRGPGPVPDEVGKVFEECVAKVSAKFHTVTTYQPSSRYWGLQWIELGIFVAGAALLAGVCVWWIRRRLR